MIETRYAFALLASILSTGLSIACNQPADFRESQSRKPNILFILTDDQGWADLSEPLDPKYPKACCKYFNTPRINRLAQEGMRFTDAYSPAPVCTPSRRSIQYGMTPARQRASAWVGEFDPKGKWSIAQAMKQADPSYQCGHFGKWGGVIVGNWKSRESQAPGFPQNVGYDASDGPTGNKDGTYHRNDWKRDVTLEVHGDPKLTFSVNRRAISFMEKNAREDTPFFVQVSYYAIHLAIQARQETAEKYKGKPDPKRLVMPGIGPMLEDMDTAIGELLDTIDRLGIRENTYVFLIADNGGQGFQRIAMKSPERARDPGRNHPLRLYKGTLYEGGIRVPVLVRGPGIKPGSISSVPVAGYDFMPTFYDLADGKTKIPQTLDGGSMREVLENEGEGKVNRPIDGLVFHYDYEPDNTNSSAYREGNLKLVITRTPHGKKVTKRELFDLSKDISESKNLAEEMRSETNRLHKALNAYLKEVE